MTESILDIYSVAAPGLEFVTAAELATMGHAARGTIRGGVAWRGSARDLYKANLWLRSASRVVVRVAEFHAGTFAELERRGKRVPWGRFVRARDSLKFRVTCHKSALYHTSAVAQRLAECASAVTGCSVVKDAELDEDADGSGGEQVFIVRLDHDTLTLSADSSGTLLHKRGYRMATAKAPMRETLAASMLLSSNWRHDEPILDPMCGSGTIPIEAAMAARKMAPGWNRSFRFEKWPGFDPAVWKALKDEAGNGTLARAPSPIVAADRDAGGVEAVAANAARAGVADDLEILHRPISATRRFGESRGWVVTNPPYGVRIGTDVRDLYAKTGQIMRTELKGWSLGFLSASAEAERQIALPLKQVFETTNGGIPIRFMVGGGID